MTRLVRWLRWVLVGLPSGRLDPIDGPAARALRSIGIRSAEDLWREIGEDFNAGVDATSAKAKIKPSQIRDLLARSVDVAGTAPPLPALEILTVVAVIIGAVFGVRAAMDRDDQALVSHTVAARDLRPFERLDDGALTIAETRSPEGIPSADLEGAVGGYLMVGVQEGAPILETALVRPGSARFDLTDRFAVRLALPAAAAALGVRPGDSITLVSNDTIDAQPVLGILLAEFADSTGFHATIAVDSAQLQRLRGRIPAGTQLPARRLP